MAMRLLDYNRWTTLVWHIDDAGGYAYVRAKSLCEISQFYYEPKTVLQKNKFLKILILKNSM